MEPFVRQVKGIPVVAEQKPKMALVNNSLGTDGIVVFNETRFVKRSLASP